MGTRDLFEEVADQLDDAFAFVFCHRTGRAPAPSTGCVQMEEHQHTQTTLSCSVHLVPTVIGALGL